MFCVICGLCVCFISWDVLCMVCLITVIDVNCINLPTFIYRNDSRYGRKWSTEVLGNAASPIDIHNLPRGHRIQYGAGDSCWKDLSPLLSHLYSSVCCLLIKHRCNLKLDELDKSQSLFTISNVSWQLFEINKCFLKAGYLNRENVRISKSVV